MVEAKAEAALLYQLHMAFDLGPILLSLAAEAKEPKRQPTDNLLPPPHPWPTSLDMPADPLRIPVDDDYTATVEPYRTTAPAVGRADRLILEASEIGPPRAAAVWQQDIQERVTEKKREMGEERGRGNEEKEHKQQ